MKNNHYIKIVKLAGVLLAIISAYFLLKYFLLLFYPFIIGITFAYMLHPIVSYLEHRLKLSRLAATIMVISICLILLTGITFLILGELIHGLTFLAEYIPEHFERFSQIIKTKTSKLYDDSIAYVKNSNFLHWTLSKAPIDTIVQSFSDSGSLFIRKILKSIQEMIILIPESITVIVFIFIAVIVMTYDYQYFRHWLRNNLSLTIRKKTLNVLLKFKKLIGNYIKAQLIIVLITAILTFTGLTILKVKHALTITLLTALVDLLPLIGTGLIFIPWISYLFLVGNYYLTIKIAIMYMLIIIIRQIIEPKILSNHLEVRPIIVIFVMFVSFQIWGFIGILLAPIFIVIFNTLKQSGLVDQIVNYIKG